MTPVWPWLVIIGLGAFHGLNPAMGWLFAVALGLHRHSRRLVLLAILPIGLGHAAAVAAVVALFLVAGVLFDPKAIRWGGAALLVGWALFHLAYGHRGRVRFGMQIGLVGLFMWSFLMATAHGAGLMLIPAMIPLHHTAHPGSELMASGSLGIAPAVVAVHSLAMLIVTGAIALVVFEWVGVGVLRRAWINLDLVWTLALLATAGLLVLL
jgi:hypothetical protein